MTLRIFANQTSRDFLDSSIEVAVMSPHPQDCSRYYECVGTAPVLRQCEAGLYWDTREGACTWPEVSGCSMQFIKVSLVTCTMYVLS